MSCTINSCNDTEKLRNSSFGRRCRKAKGDRKGYYKTYVGDPRKEVCRKTYNALVEELFKYYSGVGVTGTIEMAIEWELDYRSVIKESLEDTIDTLRYCVRRVLPEELLQKSVGDITDSLFCKIIRERIAEKHLTYSDVKTTLQVLRGAFRQSMARHPITGDPLAAVQANFFAVACEEHRRKRGIQSSLGFPKVF